MFLSKARIRHKDNGKVYIDCLVDENLTVEDVKNFWNTLYYRYPDYVIHRMGSVEATQQFWAILKEEH